jgi:hypothetical protein
MIFPYWEVRLDNQIHWLPLVPLTVHGQAASVDVLALVDSGAEYSVLGLDLAERLQISLAASTPATLVGIGEHEVPGQMVPVGFQIDKHKWVAQAVISEAANQRAILGQTGIFAFFTVSFRYSKRVIEVRRARLSRASPY